MRIPLFIMMAIGTALGATAAHAQAYDPYYPVCMHLAPGGGDYFECSFTSLAKCRASASGRGAICDVNPYYALGQPTVHRRHRSGY